MNAVLFAAGLSLADYGTAAAVQGAFDEMYNGIRTEVECNPKWKNGTGYFDHAVSDESIQEPCKSKDEHGRPIVLIPQEGGRNLVFFQRYTDGGPIIIHRPDCAGGKRIDAYDASEDDHTELEILIEALISL